MKTNKFFKAGLAFILIYSLFFFTASIEYQSVLNNNRRNFKDELIIVQTRLSNILDSRINSAKNLKTYIKSNKNFNQKDYESYVKEIYDSPSNLLRNLTFIKNTTITNVYPYEENKQSIGINLLEIDAQRDLILYAKKENKVVFTAPVYLVEGGKGIVVRVPFVIDDAYYGQIAIVFDYDQVMIQSGIQELSEKYFLTLSTYDFVGEKTNEIFSNSFNSDQMESYDIDIYDFNLKIEGIPKDGWQGMSSLFILVLVLGHIVSISGFILIFNSLKSKEKLKVSYLALETSNLQLASSNNQLKTSKEDLTFRFDELEAQKIQIQYLADRDALTGLYNRRKCIGDLENHLKEKNKLSLILFDLDNFKNINDTRGHVYGDQVLAAISNFLNEFLENRGKAYRIGGDEFLIVMENFEDINERETFMKDFFNGFEVFKSTANINEIITISAGVTSSVNHNVKVSLLMMQADLAMYASKNKGRNQYAYFDDMMYQDLNKKVKVENLLRAAVKNQDFYLVYQPIIMASTYEVYGFEALIRMKDSLLSPAVFIPIAEEIGLISTIGKWVISNALLQMQTWQDQGVILKPISINMSPRQIYEGGIEIYLEEQLKLFNIDPKLIEVEVTENIFVSNVDSNISTLDKIKNLGCTITLDDFGSGYSSLSYLTYMPAKKIKLDKALKDKFLPYEDIKVMEGLIAFCHSLNLIVVTEGVETWDEAGKLVSQGSDLLQGYIFSRPVLPDEALKLMYHCYSHQNEF